MPKKGKKEKPSLNLVLSMFLTVLALIVLSALLALVLYTVLRKLLELLDAPIQPNAYMIWVPVIALSISAILGVVLAIFISLRYLRPLTRLMRATAAVANGDYSVRVERGGAKGEVAAYIDSFNKMAEELSSVELLRSDFINTFSHEIKTPLISIRGFAKLLQNPTLTDEQHRAYTEPIVRESERLSTMSTSILLLAQYENTEIVSGKTLYSLDEQLRRCIHLQERSWLQKELEMEGELDEVQFFGNEELTEHIWSNLISNAIRFTPSGGRITVLLRQGGDGVSVSVCDTGTGMDAEMQRHIFDKFYRSRSSSGNGLGLSIVQRATELCGGQIEVFSAPGEGTTFTVTLPNDGQKGS